jgi:hypothetical protein
MQDPTQWSYLKIGDEQQLQRSGLDLQKLSPTKICVRRNTNLRPTTLHYHDSNERPIKHSSQHIYAVQFTHSSPRRTRNYTRAHLYDTKTEDIRPSNQTRPMINHPIQWMFNQSWQQSEDQTTGMDEQSIFEATPLAQHPLPCIPDTAPSFCLTAAAIIVILASWIWCTLMRCIYKWGFTRF